MLLQGRPIADMKKESAVCNYTLVELDAAKFDKFKQLVPSECFIGCNNKLPVLKIGTLPPSPDLFKPEEAFVEKIKVFVQHVELAHIDQFEKSVEAFINQQVSLQQYYQGEINERKLTVQQHNLWQPIGNKASIDLTKDQQGIIHPTGMLQVLDFYQSDLSALIFTVVYRCKCHLVY